MSITDELRELARRWPCTDYIHKDMTAIADRIDAECQKACDDAWNNGYEADYLGIEKWLTEHPQAMEKHGWVKLPKDAYGEYIHKHDKVDWRDHAGMWHENATVLAVCSDGCYVMYALDGMVIHVNKSDIRHHVPTVEDVVREFANEVYADADNEIRDRDFLCAKYAKRLTLAEGEDE